MWSSFRNLISFAEWKLNAVKVTFAELYFTIFLILIRSVRVDVFQKPTRTQPELFLKPDNPNPMVTETLIENGLPNI